MDVIVDLNQMPYHYVLPIIEWCLKHNIDEGRCIQLLEAWYSKPPKSNDDWTLTIPDKYATMFLLKWPFEGEQ